MAKKTQKFLKCVVQKNFEKINKKIQIRQNKSNNILYILLYILHINHFIDISK